MKELIIGSHVSFQKNTQLVGSVKEAVSYRANTFMFYTGAPQNTARYPIDDKLTQEGYQLMEENGIDPVDVVVHAPYIINLANTAKPDNHRFAIQFLREEMDRCAKLGMTRLVLHPGSHVSQTREEGIQNIIDGLNQVLTTEESTYICLETMAGKGTEIGNLDELKKIIENVDHSEYLKVCIDTCHLNDAGYDMTKLDDFLNEFNDKIGIDRIGCVHVNDSKNVCGAHKDRHENIGLGTLGFDTLYKIVTHPKLKDVPKILETPYVTKEDNAKEKVYPPYRFEIDMFRTGKYDTELLEHIRNFYK